MSEQLCYLSATTAIKHFSSGELSPVDILQAQIARAEKVEPTVNALAFQFYEEALQAAQAAELAYRQGRAKPLEGITLGVKDETAQQGKPCTQGSLLLKDAIADHTSPMLQRLLNAGAIAHVRTTTPEFCMHSNTLSKLWGVTRNPWNSAYSAGGSSGGSGAALASGTATLATGSDIGGSIRIPASHNGIVGYKPPYGRVPQSPPWNFDTYCHEGPMARSVADIISFQNQIAGPHPSDITSLSPKLILPNSYDNIVGMRIAYSLNLGHREVDVDVQQNTLAAVKKFQDLGAIVEEVTIDWTEQCIETFFTHIYFYAITVLKQQFGSPAQLEQLTPYVQSLFADSKVISIDDLLNAKAHEAEMYQAFTRAMASYDVLICPTAATAKVPADWDYSVNSLCINGKLISPNFGSDSMTYYFNSLSRCPVLSMPSGKDSNKVPTGIQIVGKAYDEHSVLKAASAYETLQKPFFECGDYPRF
ncbi:amidase [Dasania marina]|uniref:amidase n=1 Tax=Dasania marina TaxID=471499 RepID=UPI0003745A2B|nr:amidase [Dasania marina]